VRYVAIACDYDGTVADAGRVAPATLDALQRLRASGRRIVLVTGRMLDDLARVAPELALFDRVVAENGALLFHPATREVVELGAAPPPAFLAALRARDVPFDVGRAIVATHEPFHAAVLEAIHAAGLELQVTFNKGAVMVLPPGVNKATGLGAALADLGLSRHSVVGVGDAENDHAFLACCECAVAVAGALPALRARCDWITAGDAGAGVVELAQRLLDDDLRSLAPRLARHRVPIGHRADGTPVTLEPWGETVLLAGASGGGKTTLATALLEALIAREYQCCVIDPEGDYERLADAVVVGDVDHEPALDELLGLLAAPTRQAVANLVGVALEHRPTWFQAALSRLQALRAEAGHPAWLLVDEAHHLLPQSWDPAPLALPLDRSGLLLVTVHPDRVAPLLLAAVDVVVTVGDQPAATMALAARAAGRAMPASPEPDGGQALAWRWRDGEQPLAFHPATPRAERRRHDRKYAEGELPPERSFVFRGPDQRLRLRAQNLVVFLQMAGGVDDETWLYHLRRGDVARWFRDAVKDPALADAADAIARDAGLDAAESRERVRRAVTERYTLPA
jgi:hydroxymethylpyrimidine pyrophosphatase-like HAD family hydrolase/energy-coupling factor transporter ATP-binding protein EcfA2